MIELLCVINAYNTHGHTNTPYLSHTHTHTHHHHHHHTHIRMHLFRVNNNRKYIHAATIITNLPSPAWSTVRIPMRRSSPAVPVSSVPFSSLRLLMVLLLVLLQPLYHPELLQTENLYSRIHLSLCGRTFLLSLSLRPRLTKWVISRKYVDILFLHILNEEISYFTVFQKVWLYYKNLWSYVTLGMVGVKK